MRTMLVLILGLAFAVLGVAFCAIAYGDGIEWWFETGEQEVFVVRAQETIELLNTKITVETEAWISSYGKRCRIGIFAPIGRETDVGILYSTLRDEPTGLQLAFRYRKESVMSVPVGETLLADIWQTYLDLDLEDQQRFLDMLSDVNRSIETDNDDEAETDTE